jgi:hypothetical protein
MIFLRTAMASRTDHLTWSAYFDSVRSFTLVCVLLCISTFVFRANAKVTRQAKLGARAPAVPSRSPLGKRRIDTFVSTFMSNLIRHRFRRMS